MSNYSHEHGTITLPAAAVTPVKNAVLNAARKRYTWLYETAQAFWKALPAAAKHNQAVYDIWVDVQLHGYDPNDPMSWTRGRVDTLPARQRPQPGPPVPVPGVPARTNAFDANPQDEMRRHLDHLLRYVCWTNNNTPRRVQKADVDKLFPATNRTTTFTAGPGSITIDRTARTVAWTTSDGNHAPNHAHADPVAIALFRALAKVNWTRGTGGTIVGNSEYNDCDDPNHNCDWYCGDDYTIAEYGPRQAATTRT